MKLELDHSAVLAVALAEARKGLAEGGIPIGAAFFDASEQVLLTWPKLPPQAPPFPQMVAVIRAPPPASPSSLEAPEMK
jgi:hypothetical protein